ncbi:MAG: DNA primase [Capnocytophaga sp.]|nr:DNA primase [Capnocytophaga sp.]
MKRVIVDYKKLTKEILSLLVDKYPEGYEDKDVIKFKNIKNETVEALEVRTEDTIYLVKVSTRLATTMERYDEEEDDFMMESDSLEIPDDTSAKGKKGGIPMEIVQEQEEEEEENDYADRDNYDDDEDDEEDYDDDDDEDDEE